LAELPDRARREIVSSDDELLVLVDPADREIGTLDKSACHDGAGVLHRAFSLFVFNPAGELLIQQRQADKRLWPSYWSNSCCSHPRAGEVIADAVGRRLAEELGVNADLTFLYKFEYTARFGDVGTEHELCWVYVGRSDQDPVVNTAEVLAWRWISRDLLTEELNSNPDSFTPWFTMEWQRLTNEFASQLPS
jgi:isopentenyl-diphosphate delta-isomerase